MRESHKLIGPCVAQVKRAMLDSANDTIEQLKAEVADMQGELEDARRMAEDMEGQLRAVHEQDGTEKSNLRCVEGRGRMHPMLGGGRLGFAAP